MAMTPPPIQLKKEVMVPRAEMETLVVEVTRDAAAGTHANGATTAGEWDTYPACVGNWAEELKVKDQREAVAEEAAVGPTHHFQVWMAQLFVPLHAQTNLMNVRCPMERTSSGVDFAAHGAIIIEPPIRQRRKQRIMEHRWARDM